MWLGQVVRSKESVGDCYGRRVDWLSCKINITCYLRLSLDCFNSFALFHRCWYDFSIDLPPFCVHQTGALHWRLVCVCVIADFVLALRPKTPVLYSLCEVCSIAKLFPWGFFSLKLCVSYKADQYCFAVVALLYFYVSLFVLVYSGVKWRGCNK